MGTRGIKVSQLLISFPVCRVVLAIISFNWKQTNVVYCKDNSAKRHFKIPLTIFYLPTSVISIKYTESLHSLTSPCVFPIYRQRKKKVTGRENSMATYRHVVQYRLCRRDELASTKYSRNTLKVVDLKSRTVYLKINQTKRYEIGRHQESLSVERRFITESGVSLRYFGSISHLLNERKSVFTQWIKYGHRSDKE